MTNQQYDILKKYDRIWECVKAGGYNVSLSTSQINELNTVSKDLFNEEYTNKCAACGSSKKKRWLKGLATRYYEKQD